MTGQEPPERWPTQSQSVPERWQGAAPTQPMPLSDDERKAWLAQQVDEHLGNGWQIESRTENLVSLRYGKPINHVLHLLLTLVTCGVWALVWIYLAIFQGEKHKTISTRDADHRPQAQGDRRTLLIVVGAVFAFLVVMSIIGSFLPE